MYQRLNRNCKNESSWKFGGWLRVARSYVFKPKISIWVNFGGPRNEKGWY
jgi:hypothetical protein